MNTSYEEIDKAFLQDGYDTAKKILGAPPNAEKYELLTRALYENIDTLIHSFTRRLGKNNLPLSCKKGCSWCCSQPVFTNDWEVTRLKSFMKKRFTGERLTEIGIKAEKKKDELSSLDEKQILNSRIPCPLLAENACSVYPARPMACRIYLSADLNSCIEQFNHPASENNFARLYDFPLHAGRKMNEGVAQWLTEHNMDVRELRLEEGLSRT